MPSGSRVKETISRALEPVRGRLSAARELVSGRLVPMAHVLVPSVVLLLSLALRVSESEVAEAFQSVVFDSYQVLQPRPFRDAGVRVIDIDDESLDRLGGWPWPRAKFAQLVARLSELGVSTVAFDIVFPGPDKLTPRYALSLMPETPQVRAILRRLRDIPDGDALLAKAVADANVALGFGLLPEDNGSRPQAKAGFGYAGDNPLSYVPALAGALVSNPALEKAAAGAGNISIVPERGGMVRRSHLLFRQGKELHPALALEALRLAFGTPAIKVKSSGGSGARSFGERTGIVSVKVGPREIPTDQQGRVWLYYTRSSRDRTIPVWRVFEPGFPAKGLEGTVAFIGASAAGLKDLRATPLDPAAAGIEIQANLAEQIMLESYLFRPDWAKGAEVLLLLVLGVALIAALPRLSAVWGAVLGAGMTSGAFALSWLLFSHRQWLLDPLFPSAAALLIYVTSTVVGYLQSERDRRRLELLDKVKDELIATVSHDLRGPVNAMIMIVDMMGRGTYGPLTEKQSRNLKLIKDSGRKLTGFVSNILDAAKMKAGKMEFKKADVRLQEMLPDLVELFVLSAQAKGLSLEHQVAADLPVVSADREKLEQVVNNLVGNAMKFTPSGGKITISAALDGDAVLVSVTDTGLGISQEDIGKLFKKFQQVDLAKQKEMKVSGTGLGLSICKAVVEAHDGRIWVESEKGKGSSFRFTIPAKKDGAASSPAA